VPSGVNIIINSKYAKKYNHVWVLLKQPFSKAITGIM